jgi:hypothetical protein
MSGRFYVGQPDYLEQLNELDDLIAGAAYAADNVTVADAGNYFTATDVEGVLQEIGDSLPTGDIAELAVANTFTKAQTSQMVNLGTVTGTVTPNASLSNTFRMVLGGNITLANPTNLSSGQNFGVHIIQDATGGRTVSFGSMFKFTGGVPPELSVAQNARDFLACTYDDVSNVLVCSLGVKGAA